MVKIEIILYKLSNDNTLTINKPDNLIIQLKNLNVNNLFKNFEETNKNFRFSFEMMPKATSLKIEADNFGAPVNESIILGGAHSFSYGRRLSRSDDRRK